MEVESSNCDVLDLCTRGRKKVDTRGKTRNGYSSSNESPVFGQQPFFKPKLCVNSTFSAQDRLYSGGLLHSPTAQIESPKSNPTSFVALPSFATTEGKPRRPSKDRLTYPGHLATEIGLKDADERYAEYRNMVVAQMSLSNKSPSGNKNMKRPVEATSPNQIPSSSGDARDQAYWERRQKNNEAAKRSRNARRAKEFELSIRADWLEKENQRLICIIETLTSQQNPFRLQWSCPAGSPN